MARRNPETKTYVLGASVLTLAGIAAYYFVFKPDGEAVDTTVADSMGGAGKKDPVNLVKAHMVAKGQNPEGFQFRSQPKGKDVQVQARSKKSGKTFVFGVRGTKVKLMTDKEAKASDGGSSSGGPSKSKGSGDFGRAGSLGGAKGPGLVGPAVPLGAYSGVFQPS